nr:ABC transporter ATP-binding protein [Stackebrandtia nassauensis]
MTALSAEDVTVRLGGALIVDEVSFTVEPGEWLTVIGPNGAGKSTLLHAVAGLLAFDGRVRLYGDDLAALPRRELARRIAVVVQSPVVPEGMTVLDYVLLGRTPHIHALGRESQHDVDVALRVCERLDLMPFTTRALATLSGGERQRAILARALAQLAGTRQALLLLDEPTSALDIGHQQEVLELVDTLRAEEGLTVVSTMHELSIAGEYADRLLLLAAGRLAALGPAAEVLTTELLATHYRARVRVIDSESGPVVVPLRPDRQEY